MLTGLPARDLPGDILELPSGQGYLLTTRGELVRVAQPVTTPGDMQQVAALLPDNLHSQAETLETAPPAGGAGRGQGSGWEAVPVPADSAAARGKPLSAEDAQILALARQAMGVTDIIEAVWGSRGGNLFKTRARRVMEVISENLQEAGA
jgi:hypothetical protein